MNVGIINLLNAAIFQLKAWDASIGLYVHLPHWASSYMRGNMVDFLTEKDEFEVIVNASNVILASREVKGSTVLPITTAVFSFPCGPDNPGELVISGALFPVPLREALSSWHATTSPAVNRKSLPGDSIYRLDEIKDAVDALLENGESGNSNWLLSSGAINYTVSHDGNTVRGTMSKFHWYSIDGIVDEGTTVYDEFGFFYRMDGELKFAKVVSGMMPSNSLHSVINVPMAFIDAWNSRAEGVVYELVGDDMGFVVAKRAIYTLPSGVSIDEVAGFLDLPPKPTMELP